MLYNFHLQAAAFCFKALQDYTLLVDSTIDRYAWQSVTDELIHGSLQRVHARYRMTGSHALPYHNLSHTLDVVSAAEVLASAVFESGNIATEDMYLAKIAAAFHDVEQSKGSVSNETISADTACKAMSEYAVFDSNHLRRVREAILSTVVDRSHSSFQQKVITAEPLGRILADADLAYLGMPTAIYHDRMKRLFAEWHLDGTRDEYVAFVDMQRSFLRMHQFHTSEASALFPYKAKNISFVDDVYSSLAY